ncbi:hypothetical protein SAMN05421819_2792 [Bryocella elongata]|uniref:Uncharacterized protein n=1 Tax=Bryocella elongata TaxID=863522 RepID=A0A1H5ZRN8_9BACT|nr:hypothetical protein [Bryocella elongata]SEG38066.1 hypothetical protein SAMN05421819_2792 [Bryocella elongata]
MRTFHKTLSVLAAAVLAVALPLGAQTAGQDIKNAGHDTADASKQVAHKTAHGTKKVYHKTKHATKVAAHKTGEGVDTAAHDTKYGTEVAAKKTATGTRNVGRRIEGKPTVPNHPEDTTPH